MSYYVCVFIYIIYKKLVLKCQKILYYLLACGKYKYINKNFFESDHSYYMVGDLTCSLKLKNIQRI